MEGGDHMQCKATAKQTGRRCRNRAVKGYTVCRFHGANPTNRGGGARPGNKNAVTTGEHETIWPDQLDETERSLYDRISLDVLQQLDDEIRLVTIRERRMLQRIVGLGDEDLTLVKTVHSEGNSAHGRTSKTERKLEATLGQAQQIEESLTRVQALKARLLDLKHKIESGHGPDEPDIGRYLLALGKVAGDVWAEKDDSKRR